MNRILIIQTAFIGDVVLSTALAVKLHHYYPDALIDFLVRKGNESLFDDHPFLYEIITWDKNKNKYLHLYQLLGRVRKNKYDLVVCVQRFAAAGFLAAFSGSKFITGFAKNPFSGFFTHKYDHQIGKKGDKNYLHESERNQKLIDAFSDPQPCIPKIYPSSRHRSEVAQFCGQPFITISPASVWFTKQFPKEKWIELINSIDKDIKIILLGGAADSKLCDEIISKSRNDVLNLAGKLSYLESAALMEKAIMNYTNDSAPLHFASAVNAPVTAVFCSTIPEFGFGPLSEVSKIVEIISPLYCRPCGLHGYKACPHGHFKCAWEIEVRQVAGTF